MNDVLTEEQRQLVLDNMNLVRFLFNKSIYFSRKWEFKDDIIQDGMEGLCLAAARYRPDKGVAFSTFASMYILGYMKRQIREFNYGGVFRVSRSDADLKYRIHKEFKDSLISEITSDDIEKLSELLNESAFKISSILNLNQEVSLDFKVSMKDDSTSEFQEIIEDIKSTTQLKEVDLNLSIQTALSQINFKNDLHKQIYIAYINGICCEGRPPKQVDLSKRFNIVQATVSRVIKIYNEKLKGVLFNE